MTSPAQYEKIILITNPGSRFGDRTVDDLVEGLPRCGSLHVHRTDEVANPGQLIRRKANESTLVVVGGGDGTLNWLLDDVLESGAVLGVLPLGTANDFAQTLGIPPEPAAALAVIRDGHRRRVDVGRVNGHTFLNAAGVGLGPQMTKRMRRDAKSRWGVFAYPMTLAGVMRRFRGFTARLRVDGEPHRLRCLQVTVASGVHYGGKMTISADARPDDGLLRVLCVRPQRPWRLLAKFFQLRWGDLRDRTDLVLLAGKAVQLDTRRAMDIAADGELVSITPLRCEILKRRLTVLAPPPQH